MLDKKIIGKCVWSGCCEGKGEESRADVIFWQLDEEVGMGFEVTMGKVMIIIRKELKKNKKNNIHHVNIDIGGQALWQVLTGGKESEWLCCG